MESYYIAFMITRNFQNIRGNKIKSRRDIGTSDRNLMDTHTHTPWSFRAFEDLLRKAGLPDSGAERSPATLASLARSRDAVPASDPPFATHPTRIF